MRAKVNKTGKITNVELNLRVQPVSDSGAKCIYTDENGVNYYDYELSFNFKEPDWLDIKIKLLNSALQGLNANSTYLKDFDSLEVANNAYKQSEFLVEKLKEDFYN